MTIQPNLESIALISITLVAITITITITIKKLIFNKKDDSTKIKSLNQTATNSSNVNQAGRDNNVRN